MDIVYRFEVYPSYTTGTLEYIVRYYDVPVIGSGETIEEAIEEAQGNLEFFLACCEDEGVVIPQPSIHEDKHQYSGKITFRMSKSLHKKIDQRATKEGISINSLINEAVSCYISQTNIIEEIKKETIKELTRINIETINELYDYAYKNNSMLSKNISFNNISRDKIIV